MGATKHSALLRSNFTRRSLGNLVDKPGAVSEDRRIADLLLDNNCTLLALICQVSFVGDTAASVSLEVLSLLRQQGSEVTEAFLKRLLRSRILGYIVKNRDLSDIIRDNSMATMLLNAFARYEGLHYLGQSLTEPLRDVLPYADGCEIDPQKFPRDMDASAIEDQLAENEARLKGACSRVLTSVVEKRELMPGSLRRMCHYLRETVEEIHKEQGLLAAVHMQSPMVTSVLPAPPTPPTPKLLSTVELEESGEPAASSFSASPLGKSASVTEEPAESEGVDDGNAVPAPTAISEEPAVAQGDSETTTPRPSTEAPSPKSNPDATSAKPNADATISKMSSGTDLASKPPGTSTPSRKQSLKDTDTASSPLRFFGRLLPRASQGSITSSPLEGGDETSSPRGSAEQLSASSGSGNGGASTILRKRATLKSSRRSSGVEKSLDLENNRTGSHSRSNSTGKEGGLATIGTTIPLAPPSGGGKETGLTINTGATGTYDQQKASYILARKAEMASSWSKQNSAGALMSPPLSAVEPASTGGPGKARVTKGASDTFLYGRARAMSTSTSRIPLPQRTSMGYLSIPEKVVGSFLFLRFFVPAVTSPDTYGLIEGRVSPAARRGLVLCGKILTAMCNDVDFGNKEQYLMPLNHFLRENREKIKDYLTFASSMPPEVSEKSTNPASASRPQSTTDRPISTLSPSSKPLGTSSTRTSSGLRKALSRSMPSLKADLDLPPTSTPTIAASTIPRATLPGKLPRSRSGDYMDMANFYAYLAKSVHKIERELDEQLFFLPPEEADYVLANFFELKRVLEGSSYAEGGAYLPGGQSRAKSKSQTIFAKLSARWGLKGLFTGQPAKTSRSMDDLSRLTGAGRQSATGRLPMSATPSTIE